MSRLIRWLTGKPARVGVEGRWFYAALVEANMAAGQLAYGW
jgi:hypothetical protein